MVVLAEPISTRVAFVGASVIVDAPPVSSVKVLAPPEVIDRAAVAVTEELIRLVVAVKEPVTFVDDASPIAVNVPSEPVPPPTLRVEPLP